MGSLRRERPGAVEASQDISLTLNAREAAWAERVNADDKLDAKRTANLAKLSITGAFPDKPPRARTPSRPMRPLTAAGGGAAAASAASADLVKLHQLLRTADPKNTGRIGSDELRWVATKSALDVDDERTAALLATCAFANKKDGTIDYVAFERGVHRLASAASSPAGSRPHTAAPSRALGRAANVEAAARPRVALDASTPRDASELIGTDNPYTSALFHRYKGLRMLQAANLQLTTPPQRTVPRTSHVFHDNVYRTKQRSLRAWQDYQDHTNVLIQRPSEFPGVPTFDDTAVSTYQRDFAAGRPISAYCKSARGVGGGGVLGSSLQMSQSLTATVPNVRTLHTAHGARITRSQPPLERDYTRDPVAKMIWTSSMGWTNPPSHS